MSIALPAPMRRALELAAAAATAGEVPVGAVLTRDGIIIAEAGNDVHLSPLTGGSERLIAAFAAEAFF